MENTGWAMPIQLAVAEDVGLGSLCKPSGLGPVSRKLSSNKAIKERDSPVHALVTLGRFRIDCHGLGLGSRGLGDRGGLGPYGGFDQWALFHRRGIVNGRLVEVSGKDVRGDRGPCRRHLGQFIRGLVGFSRNVVEFEAVKLVF